MLQTPQKSVVLKKINLINLGVNGMKRKFLLSLILTAAATNIFAMEIHGGKLLSHKEFIPTNMKIEYKKTTFNPTLLAKLKSQADLPNMNQYVNIYARITSLSGNLDDAEPIVSANTDNKVFIHNGTSSSQIYNIENTTCILYIDSGSCSRSVDEILLDPYDGYYNDSMNPSIISVIPTGISKLRVQTTIAVTTSGVVTSTSDEAYLSIDNNKRKK